MDEFRGVKVSGKYDFDPDRNKYAQEPPKAGANKAKAMDKKSDANQLAQNTNNSQADQDGDDDDDEDDDDDDQMDINEIKKKILKVVHLLQRKPMILIMMMTLMKTSFRILRLKKMGLQ